MFVCLFVYFFVRGFFFLSYEELSWLFSTFNLYFKITRALPFVVVVAFAVLDRGVQCVLWLVDEFCLFHYVLKLDIQNEIVGYQAAVIFLL